MNQEILNLSEFRPPNTLMAHVENVQNLMGRTVSRRVQSTVSTLRLMPQLLEADNLGVLLQMQSAITARLARQNDEWIAGCQSLAKEMDGLKHANTMTKLLEQQFNLMGQWTQLIGNQATALMALQENIDVDFAYWVSQKVNS